jgi:LysR family pca operon transcriptional activator
MRMRNGNGSERTSQIDLRRMRTVVEVARAEAITTAAETLGLTQSAVSRTVAEVEDALGLCLFDRLPRGIQLTAAGERFVIRAKRVLADVADLISDVQNSEARVTGRVRVGMASSGDYAMPALTLFASAYPDVALESFTGQAQLLCPRVLHGELDLVIGSSSYLSRWRELEVTPLVPMHFACMVREDHPLTEMESPGEIDVLSYPVILPENVDATYADIAQRYIHHGLPRLQAHYVTNNFRLAARLVRATDAFYPLMHPSEKFDDLAERGFVLLRDAVEMPLSYLSFARAANRPKTGVIAAFEKQLVESLGTEVP